MSGWSRAIALSILVHGVGLALPVRPRTLPRPKPRPLMVSLTSAVIAPSVSTTAPRLPKQPKQDRADKRPKVRRPKPSPPSVPQRRRSPPPTALDSPTTATVAPSRRGDLAGAGVQRPRQLPRLKSLPTARKTAGAARRRPRGLPEGLKRLPNGGYRLDGGEFTAHINPDGSFYFEDHAFGAARGALNSFAVDLTDVVMRQVGNDPYLARKRAFIQQTTNLREELRSQATLRDLRASVAGLERRLTRLWSNPRLSSRQKRRILFEIWDGVAETGAPLRVRAGELVRRAVLRFIRTRLPPSSDGAYSSDELRRLDQIRTASVAFDPYGRGLRRRAVLAEPRGR